MSLVRSAAIVGVAAALSRLLGFARDVLFAQALGAGPVADAFLAVFRLPNLVRRVLSEGGLNAGYVPLYAQIKADHGAGAATRFASEALSALVVVAGGLLAVIEIGASLVVLVLAAGTWDDPALLERATFYTRLMAPFIPAAMLASLVGAFLNGERRFLATSLAPLAVNAVLVAALLGLAHRPGMPPSTQAAWLAAATGLSGLFHLGAVSVAAARVAGAPRLVRPRLSPDVRRLLELGTSALAASGAAQLMILAGTGVASFTPSGLSWLYYADRVFQLPLGFVASAVGVVLLPEMVARHAAGDRAACLEAQNRALETALLLALPAGVALALLAHPLAAVLFQRGAFGPQDTDGVAGALAGLGLGLPFAAGSKVLSQTLFARGAVTAAVRAGALGVLVAAGAALALSGVLGVFGIGLGISVGFASHAVALARALRAGGLWGLDVRLRARTGRIAAASALMGLGLLASRSILEGAPGMPRPPLLDALLLAAVCVGGLSVYGVAAWRLGAVTEAELSHLAKKA